MRNYKDMFTGEIQWTDNEKRMLKHLIQNDGISCFRYFFKNREGQRLRINWHHLAIDYCLQAIYKLKINRLIINIPPGFTKTEQAVINFVIQGLAINPMSRYLHLSYSKTLVNQNSSKIRETIRSPEFQELFPMPLKKDKDSLELWETEERGAFRCVQAGGAVTGFRAGFLARNKFTGALIIDDPVKPDDTKSDIKRENVNSRFNATIRSRLNNDSIPLILIMQRIHEEDLTGYLLKGGSKEKWHHLNIPAILDNYNINDYPKEFDHGIPIDLNELLQCIKNNKDYNFE